MFDISVDLLYRKHRQPETMECGMTTEVQVRMIVDAGYPDVRETIQNPVLAEHVKVGVLIWYHGYNGCFPWSCPAVIIEVNENERWFRIRSMDDMNERAQRYVFDIEDGDPYPYERLTMRLANMEQVVHYLERRGKTLNDIPGYRPE